MIIVIIDLVMLLKKVIEVLDFLVNRGSTVDFLLREDIL